MFKDRFLQKVSAATSKPVGSYFLLTCKLLATLIIGSKKSRELLLISHLQPEHRIYNPGVLALAENHMDKSKHQPMLRIDIPNRSHYKFNLRDGMDWRNYVFVDTKR